MRDAYYQLRRSTADVVHAPGMENNGVPLRASMADDGSDAREVTLLENGLIMERVDLRREEREERDRRRVEERRTRKISRASVGTGVFSGFMSDASSLHSASHPLQKVSYGSRSQISLTTPTSPTTRRLSSVVNLPPRPPLTPGQSQASSDPPSTPRFLGFRHWRGAFGSEASLHHTSGSMMDMQ
jgi:hypothetical protein